MKNSVALLLLGVAVISISLVPFVPQPVNAVSNQTSIKLEQCHNGNPTVVDCDDPLGNENNWGQGSANKKNSLVFEGNSQNYRIIIENLPEGKYSLVIEQDLTKGGTMTQDFWTGPGNILTENFPTIDGQGIHPCVDTKGNQSGFCNPFDTPYEVDIPLMGDIISLSSSSGGAGNSTLGNAINSIQIIHNNTLPPNQISASMLLHGNISNASLEISNFSGNVNSDSSIQGTLNFTTNADGNVVLYYGGHISKSQDYDNIGRDSAINIPGSPYHNRLISFDGINGSPGKKDMQLAIAETASQKSLTVIKEVLGGSAVPDDFDLTVNNIPVISDNPNFYPLGAVLSINETQQSDYLFTSILGDNCPTNLDEAFTLTQDTVCTITNTFDPPSLTVIKEVLGGSAVPDDFDLTVNGNQVLSGNENFYSENSLLSLGETLQPNYIFSGITGIGCPENLDVLFTLTQDTVCTITNTFDPPSLTVIKNIVGSDADPDAFALTVNSESVLSGETNFHTAGDELSIDETQIPDHDFLSITGENCPTALGESFTITQDAECTVNNYHTDRVVLEIIKHVVNDDDGTNSASDFTMIVDATNPSENNFQGDELGRIIAIDPGDYSVTESGPGGYTASFSPECSGTAVPGDILTCTITNDDTDDNDDGGGGGTSPWQSKPTFGLSHYTSKRIVDNGFFFNDDFFNINDNHHFNFTKQEIKTGEEYKFAATVWAEKYLQVQEFLFGIPEVGQGDKAEVRIEVWFDYDEQIDKVEVHPKDSIIDISRLAVTHEKSNCQESDVNSKCDTIAIFVVFLEPIKDKVMAIKAIDFKNRYQITYLNDGFDISGKSYNPMKTMKIPSTVKDEGLIIVTQIQKYSPYWISDDGRLFEKNNFDSFKQINQKFERFQDFGDPKTRLHSAFGELLAYEQMKAMKMFNSTNFVSQLPDSFSHEILIKERLTDEIMKKMSEQEKIAKEFLEAKNVQSRW